MPVIFSVTSDKTEVENGETFTYIAHVQNDLSVATDVRVTFYERMPDGFDRILNTQTKPIGSGGTDYFYLSLVANRVAGYEYKICAKVGVAGAEYVTDSECAPIVKIRETSLGILVESCSVDKTEVDVGESVTYTAVVRNATGIQKHVYIDFYDRDREETLAMYDAWILPYEVATFAHTMVCDEPLRRYRIGARWVSENGEWLGSSAYASPVMVSDVPAGPGEPGAPGSNGSGGGLGALLEGLPLGPIVLVGTVIVAGGLLYLFKPGVPEPPVGDTGYPIEELPEYSYGEVPW